MDVNSISQIISNVGFPICACIALYIMVKDMQKAHKEEMDGLKQALDANTLTLSRLETILKMLDRRGNTDGEN